MRDPYEDLGVAKDADDETIKAAYKEKVKETHPDKVGGDRKAFDKVQDAYSILRDPEKREHYDKTGKEKQEDKAMHLSIIASLFEQLLAKEDLPYNFNYVDTVKDSLSRMLDDTHGKLKSLTKEIAKLEKLKNKFHRKNKKGRKIGENEPTNFFKQAIESKIKSTDEGIKKGEKLKTNIIRAIEVMDDYEFEIDKNPPAMKNEMSGDARDAFNYIFSELRRKGGPFGSGGSWS